MKTDREPDLIEKVNWKRVKKEMENNVYRSNRIGIPIYRA